MSNASTGIVHIRSTFTSIMVIVADTYGNTISWTSSGKDDFRDGRKSMPFVVQTIAETAAHTAIEHGLKTVVVFVNGCGQGREIAIHALRNAGLEVTMIKDTTPIPHNGSRLSKRQCNII